MCSPLGGTRIIPRHVLLLQELTNACALLLPSHRLFGTISRPHRKEHLGEFLKEFMAQFLVKLMDKFYKAFVEESQNQLMPEPLWKLLEKTQKELLTNFLENFFLRKQNRKKSEGTP